MIREVGHYNHKPKIYCSERIKMSYILVDTILIEMITSKDINVSILYNGTEYIVLDSRGLYEAKGFMNINEAKEYITNAYNLKA